MLLFDPKITKHLLGIRTRDTFNRDRAVLGLQDQRFFATEDLTRWKMLRLWLSASPGINSREAFKRYYTQPALLRVLFRRQGIDLDREIQQFTEQLK